MTKNWTQAVGVLALLFAFSLGLLTWRNTAASTLPSIAQSATATAAVATPSATARAASPTPVATRTAVPTVAPTKVVTPAAESAEVLTSTTETGAPQTLADLAEYNGIPVGFTADGYPFMGDPAAPVRMDEFSDYLCPFCGRHYNETAPTLIDEYVLTGKLQYVFRDFPIAELHPHAPEGHQAALCVGQDDPVAYWAMYNALFGRQQEWNQLPDVSDFLAGVAEEAGADPEVYKACMDSGETIARVNAGIAAGQQLGFNGTPTFVFSGAAFTDTYTLVGAYPVDSFRQWIDAMAAGSPPPAEAQAPKPQLPLWANEEGLAPDPERPGFNMAGDPYKGADDAPLTIIEFSDFQCPACATHANEVQPALDKLFVDTGKIRWVFKNRPLPMHPLAPVGAAAAECAADQGQFWEMHDAIYTNVAKWASDQESWTEGDAETSLIALAKELGLDNDLFSECLQGRDAMERVLYDVYDAEGVVGSTPTFIAVYGGQGTILSGGRPADAFIEILNGLVADAEGAASVSQ